MEATEAENQTVDEAEAPMDAIYRFGDFLFEPAAASLETTGESPEVVELADLQLRLLELLVRDPGRIVPRQELQDTLWGPGTFLEADNSLNTAVSRLRDALGDSAAEPQFIATVPRRGYRFVAPVHVLEASQAVYTETPGWVVPAAFLGLAIAALIFSLATRTTGASERVANVPAAETEASQTEVPDPESATAMLVRARQLAARGTQRSLDEAIAVYLEALTLEPNSCEAIGGLASTYLSFAEYDYWRPRDAYVTARALVERAFAIDPKSPHTQIALAHLTAVADWRFRRSLRTIDAALKAAPDSIDARLFKAQLLSALGSHDKAISQSRRALGMSPASPEVNALHGWLLFRARRSEEAIEQLQRTISMAPRHADAYDMLKWVYLHEERDVEAAAIWTQLVEIEEGGGPEFGESLAELGIEGQLRANIARRLEHSAEAGYNSSYDLVLDLVQVGEIDQAFHWLERSIAERETDVVSVKVDPRLDDLRQDPRFEELIEPIGLP